MLLSTITQKGQITVPKKIRDALKLKTNDQVVFVQRGNNIIIKPVKNILSIRGSIKVNGEQDFSSVQKHTQTKIAKRIANE